VVPVKRNSRHTKFNPTNQRWKTKNWSTNIVKFCLTAGKFDIRLQLFKIRPTALLGV